MTDAIDITPLGLPKQPESWRGEILIEADLSRFEGFARRQVGGIDFGLAVADAHRAGHVAHADFVVAHLVPDVGGGFTPLDGGVSLEEVFRLMQIQFPKEYALCCS